MSDRSDKVHHGLVMREKGRGGAGPVRHSAELTQLKKSRGEKSRTSAEQENKEGNLDTGG